MIEIWFKGMVLFTAPLKEAKRDKLIMLSFAFISSGLVFILELLLSPEFLILELVCGCLQRFV